MNLRSICTGSLKLNFVVILFALISSCSNSNRRFKLLTSNKTNIDFNNQIIENDTFNIIEYGHIYNGGGVAIADFNNDGLQDLYFTGNMVSNRMFLNKGGFEFEDVTSSSNTSGQGKWCYGVAIVDINNDGYRDIYIAATAHPDSLMRENILYVNLGISESGIPQFENLAKEYGLDDNSHTTNAVFFDYDNDGDLDVYLLVNKMEFNKDSRMNDNMDKVSSERYDKLYKNEWNEELGHAVFREVSKEAGIDNDGYGLGVNVSDINNDGYKDIYVTNDYYTQDLTYVNQGDGTFKNLNSEYFKHTSYSAMGNDVADYNNDGLLDIFALDMLPEDNFRKKTMVPANNYVSYLNRSKNGYQYVRNTLQVNQGFLPLAGKMVFSEIGIYAGIAETDWSWAPMVADFDNDGFRDLIVTNGFPKDVTDRDYVEFRTEYGPYMTSLDLVKKIPSVKIKNYAFKNDGNGRFNDVAYAWGIDKGSFSHGAAYGDLDNDGDLDYVVNNMNDEAFVYKNLTVENQKRNGNWIKVSLTGDGNNINAIGTIIKLYSDGEIKYWDHTISRGYLSSMDENIHFGLGACSLIDSMIVLWPGNRVQKLKNISVNQTLQLDIEDASLKDVIEKKFMTEGLFSDVSALFKDVYEYKERDFNDFNVQALLPHRLSQYGPGMSVGDVNGDGMEDIFLGGANFFKGVFLIQTEEGSFINSDLLPDGESEFKKQEEMGSLLFDADGDGDNDLYLVSGSYEFAMEDGAYQDRFFRNNEGKFELVKDALPEMNFSGSCVKAADFDQDGDLDLFVGGHLFPHEYPRPVDSYMLINESTKDKVKFTKAAKSVNSSFEGMGMVTDALWTDFNNDSWVDLMVVGEWMPIKFFENRNGHLTDITPQTGIATKIGWWNSLASIDIDHDGDLDYVAGNLGTNSLFRASEKYPLSVYFSDFNHDKKYDALPFSFFKNEDNEYSEYPSFTRVDFQKQIPQIADQYPKHADFGRASISDILNPTQLETAYVVKANYMMSSIIENKGNGQFEIRPLPGPCQWAPIYGIVVEDFNRDGNEDILMVGNDFSAELLNGKYDALNGLVLLGDGKREFKLLSGQESGVYFPGDAKALAKVIIGNETVYVSSENRGSLRAFKPTKFHQAGVIKTLHDGDFRVQFEYEDGLRVTKEFYYGNSFLSQSSRTIYIPENAVSVKITNFKGEEREAK